MVFKVRILLSDVRARVTSNRRGSEKMEDITWPRRDTKFLFECKYFTSKRWERRELLCSHINSDHFTCENNMIFSSVKITGFCTKAHLVFHWCLYNKWRYLWERHHDNKENNHQDFTVSMLTLEVPRVTKVSFLPTVSMHNQKKTLWELMKWSPDGQNFDLLTNSLWKCMEIRLKNLYLDIDDLSVKTILSYRHWYTWQPIRGVWWLISQRSVQIIFCFTFFFFFRMAFQD